jgi:hypothetical protein
MKSDSVSSEDQITNALYRDYSQFKRALFADILKNNPVAEGEDEKEWQLLLFKKTQKLLDRLLFIFFAEDCGLLPPNSIMKLSRPRLRNMALTTLQPIWHNQTSSIVMQHGQSKSVGRSGLLIMDRDQMLLQTGDVLAIQNCRQVRTLPCHQASCHDVSSILQPSSRLMVPTIRMQYRIRGLTR